jgi:phage baseplate assembly protein V
MILAGAIMIRSALLAIQRRITFLITKTILVSLDDSGAIQKLILDCLKDERRGDVDRYQEFGFSSNPPEGAEIIMLSLGGSRSHNIGIASEDRRYRLKNLAPGESVLYNQAGDYVKIKADGTIEVKASTKVLVDSPMVEMTGDLQVAGNVDVGGNITAVGNITSQANIVAVGNVTAAAVTAAGAIVGGSVADGAGSVSSLRGAYNVHTHAETGTTTSGPTPTV